MRTEKSSFVEPCGAQKEVIPANPGVGFLALQPVILYGLSPRLDQKWDLKGDLEPFRRFVVWLVPFVRRGPGHGNLER